MAAALQASHFLYNMQENTTP